MRDKGIKIKNTIKEHIINNSKEYIIVFIIFIIGIFLGVFFINNSNEETLTEITSYLSGFIDKMKNTSSLQYVDLLKNSIFQNLILTISIWFFGTTVIGIPIVFGLVLYRGFCLGYTISACIAMMGLSKGISFILLSLVAQNLLAIPAILALAVSGFKLYKSIVKDNRKENIKLEFIRHTLFSILMLILLIISSLTEVFISTNALKGLIKYF